MPGRRMAGAWLAALLVEFAGLALIGTLASGATGTNEQELLRLHLPWLFAVLLAVVAAAVVWRDRAPRAHWLLATVTVPLLSVAIGTVAGASGASTLLASVLFAAEGVGGILAGLAVTRLFEPADTGYR
ncbi:MAG: hypothetical protein ABIS86_17715 [Streptosporangiaceae bacterium]